MDNPQKPKTFHTNEKKKPRPVPPMRACRECGVGMRSWRHDPLCAKCTKDALAPQEESLRDFRARLKASENPPRRGIVLLSLIPALDYCDQEGISDPRSVTAICLCGREMLLDGSYQRMMRNTGMREEG